MTISMLRNHTPYIFLRKSLGGTKDYSVLSGVQSGNYKRSWLIMRAKLRNETWVVARVCMRCGIDTRLSCVKSIRLEGVSSRVH